MNESEALRIKQGQELLADHLIKITDQAIVFVGALQGFRRDLATSLEAMPGYMRAEFVENANLLSVPPLADGMSFSGLADMCRFCEDALDGSMQFTFPSIGEHQDEKKQLLEEMQITHKNLLSVADTGHRLYEALGRAGYEFDLFNSKNNEVSFHEADILWNRDALNLATATARALSERAVRLDIDLTEAMQG